MKRKATETPEELRDSTRYYAHNRLIPNVLDALIKWSKTDREQVKVQYVAMNMKKGCEYYTSRHTMEEFDDAIFLKYGYRHLPWRLQVVQFCPVIDVDIFKEGGDNPVLWDLYKKGIVSKQEIIQFTFQYLLDCLHQYIPKGTIKYFADWGNGKGIHVWFTSTTGNSIIVDDIPLNGVPLGVYMANLIQEKGLWKRECISPITSSFIDKVCRELSITDAVQYIGDNMDPYYKTLIRQYKNDYVELDSCHKYSNFLIRRMNSDGQESFHSEDVLRIMFGFLYPNIDVSATGSSQTISLPYERTLKGFYRYHYCEPEQMTVNDEAPWGFDLIEELRQ